jgi:hypothetical protein
MGNEQILARGKRNLRHRLNRVIQLATRTLVDNGNENGGRKKSFEGFPSLVIAAGVNKGRLDGLTLKAKPNFVSTDTAPDFLVDSGRGPTRAGLLLRGADERRRRQRLSPLGTRRATSEHLEKKSSSADWRTGLMQQAPTLTICNSSIDIGFPNGVNIMSRVSLSRGWH